MNCSPIFAHWQEKRISNGLIGSLDLYKYTFGQRAFLTRFCPNDNKNDNNININNNNCCLSRLKSVRH